jgi:hypothetical protein
MQPSGFKASRGFLEKCYGRQFCGQHKFYPLFCLTLYLITQQDYFCSGNLDCTMYNICETPSDPHTYFYYWAIFCQLLAFINSGCQGVDQDQRHHLETTCSYQMHLRAGASKSD